MIPRAASSISSTLYAQMRDSSSRTGYNVRYGLGRKEARIVVGELDGIVVPCVAVSKELRMSTTSHIMLHISKLGNLNLSFEMFGGNVGAGVLTEELGVSAALFVGSSFLVSCWLLRFGLVIGAKYFLSFDLSSFD